MSLIPTREQEEFNKLFPLPKMTNKGEWVEYTGSDEQISELNNAVHGVCLKFEHATTSFVYSKKDISTVNGVVTLSNTVTHYLICNPHPLADMICQWARTGQPVWVRMTLSDYWSGHKARPGNKLDIYDETNEIAVLITNFPDWNIPNAEYSFTAFEE